jgi:arabinofuranosyltransferase
MVTTPSKSSLYLLIAVVGAGYGILVLHAMSYFPFLADDAFISMRYAARLLAGEGLTWTAGAPVEGYSNLLWTLSLALIGGIGIDGVLSVRILGFLSTAAIFGASAFIFRRATPGNLQGAVLASLTLATAAPLAAWTVGGLEQPMVMALFAWGCALLIDVVEKPHRISRVLVTGVLFGAMCITRPDAPLLLVALLGTALLVFPSRHGRRTIAGVLLLAAIFPLAQLVFRLVYYRDWVPNTARVKVVITEHTLSLGLRYAAQSWVVLVPLLAGVILLIMWVHRTQRVEAADSLRWAIVVAVPAVCWLGYMVLIGGDVFPAYRQLLPVIVILALVIGLVSRGAPLLTLGSSTALVAVVAFAIWNMSATFSAEHTRARLELWEWEGKEVGLFLKARFGHQKPVLAVEAAGAVPYWSELDCIDLLGLNDSYIACHPPSAHGQGATGHDMGDADYVLRRAPDLIILIGPRGAFNPSGTYIEATIVSNSDFQRNYVPINFWAPDLRHRITTMYVRRGSDRVDWPALLRDRTGDRDVRVHQDQVPFVYKDFDPVRQ